MTEEFIPSGLSNTIFKDRYAFTEIETWQEACLRVAQQMAIAEVPEKQKQYLEKFYNVLVSNKFVPGGRIWYNSGRTNPQLLNCFVLDPNKDSKEGWGKSASNMIITSMTGGGCGDDFSDVRPRNSSISGQKGIAPGAVELMRLIDNCAEPIRNGGQRRVALMFSLDLDHPDIEEFLNAKLTKGELTNANVSVRSKYTKEFIKAVKNDADWELSWKGKYKRTVKAKTLWDTIVKNAYNSAEPGFLNWELVESESNIWYIEPLVTTNPCITGDTLIATADGRNAVSIEQLCTEGKDVPVYSTNTKSGVVEIKIGRNPRKTGIKKEVWKLTLDDGSFLKATPDHKILTKNLTYVELKNLKPNQSIFPFNSFNSNSYRQISNVGAAMKGGNHRNRRQYRLIAEFNDIIVDPKEYAIHHKDFNSTNDAQKNKLPQRLNNKARFGTFNNFKSLIINNHKVRSVEFLGYEDVYNITVDDNHNYHVITSWGDDKFVKSSGICVKNCGEIALSAYDCCCLGHLVLTRFISNGVIDYHSLGDTIRVAVRFLDNVLSVNSYPLPEMKAKSQALRRIGLGTTALADTLAILGLKYGSDEGNKFIDKLYRFISKAAYEASIMLAVEKGAFPLCNPEKHIESGFMKRMPAKIRSLVAEHGIRNCCILTQAPTGTVSILSGNCSSGIEPVFAPAYERRYWDQEVRKTELIFHPLFKQFIVEGKNVDHFICSRDLSVRDHMEVQRIVQRHVDNAVSKTINIAHDYPMEDVEKLWLEYLPYLKGTTFYRENTRGFIAKDGTIEEPPLLAIPIEEAKKRLNEIHKVEAENVDDCTSGICGI